MSVRVTRTRWPGAHVLSPGPAELILLSHVPGPWWRRHHPRCAHQSPSCTLQPWGDCPSGPMWCTQLLSWTLLRAWDRDSGTGDLTHAAARPPASDALPAWVYFFYCFVLAPSSAPTLSLSPLHMVPFLCGTPRSPQLSPVSAHTDICAVHT